MTELYRDQLNWNLWWWDLVLVYFYICFSVGSNVHQVEDNCWVRPISEKWTHLTLLMEKEMATHSSTLAWKIPWTEEPGRLQSMRSWNVRHDWVTSLSLSCIGEGNGNPLQCSCLENPRDGRAWWAAVYGVAQSWTRLKRLSSSSSSIYIPGSE